MRHINTKSTAISTAKLTGFGGVETVLCAERSDAQRYQPQRQGTLGMSDLWSHCSAGNPLAGVRKPKGAYQSRRPMATDIDAGRRQGLNQT